MSKPIAVLISDVHYNIQTLELADAAMRQAINKANGLHIPLIVAGDLHDTKANMRAECINAMIDTFKLCETPCLVLRGNHDQVNEKSIEHSLNFLRPYVQIVDYPMYKTSLGFFIPYHHDIDELRIYLKSIDGQPLIIMHQGLQGSDAGEYIQDKSALTYDDVKDFRVISGHYHRRQDIKTGRPQKGAVGLFSYIGNPFTLNFGEANDPPKGFQILMDDGTLEFVPTNLRKHVKFELDSYWLSDPGTIPPTVGPEDLLWVKIHDTKEKLSNITKEKVPRHLSIKIPFRLDLIPTDGDTKSEHVTQDMTQAEVLDTLIDSISSSDHQKTRLKELWRNSAGN